MYRIHENAVYVPHLFEDGTYGAANPAFGRERHHIANRVRAATLEELRRFHAKGWPIWMSARGTRDRRLISKGIVDAPAPADASSAARVQAAAPVTAPRAHREIGKVSATVAPAVQLAPSPVMATGDVDPAAWLSKIASLSEAEATAEIAEPRRLLMASVRHGDRRLDIAYAPFDHVNVGAKVVIVGITPGRQQMQEAIAEARRAMSTGCGMPETLARAKVHASFAGPMRTNVVKMLDAVAVNDWLGIASTASLWGADSALAHFTSAIRYPTFVEGENYSRSPDMNKVPFLIERSRKWLGSELVMFPDALIVPMGDMVSQALFRIGRSCGVDRARILDGMPHAGTANNGRVNRFLHAPGSDPWRKRFHEIAEKVSSMPKPSALKP